MTPVANRRLLPHAGAGTPHYLRRAGLFTQALWGRYFAVRPDAELEQPCLRDSEILLPQRWQDLDHAAELYRAAACHAAAHRLYGGPALAVGELRPRQQVLIGALEDARVEALALDAFPGLRRLWGAFHCDPLPDTLQFPVLVRRLARALLLGGSEDDNAWVRKGLHLFQAQAGRLREPEWPREIGLQLAHDLGQMRIAMNDGKPFVVAEYRDDNRHLWVEQDNLSVPDAAERSEPERRPQGAFLRETGEGRVLDLDEARGRKSQAPTGYVRETEQEAVLEFRRHRHAPVESVVSYPEWHHRLQLLRRDWCQVRDSGVPEGDPRWAEAVLHAHRPVVQRLRRIAQGLRLEKVQRARRQADGDEMDYNALVAAQLELRCGREPDPRVYFRVRPQHDRGLASLVLLDLSESCNAPAPETGRSRLDLTREAALLLGHALEPMGETFALHGFQSQGRHAVHYRHIKDFDEAFDESVMARIAGLEAGLSTRLGAALRHATGQLAQRAEQRRLLLVVTDGAPSDIDVHDDEHLILDVRHAVREAAGKGVLVYCLCLDPGAQPVTRRMFGGGRYRMLDHLARLPDLLPQLLLTLVRRY